MDISEKRQRKRVPNFTADEKALLTKLINSRKDIIECKMTDGKTVTKKKLAWEAITLEFNSDLTAHKRDTITLKRAWDNMKAVTRKARALERGDANRTDSEPILLTQPVPQVGMMHMVKAEDASPSVICEINPFDHERVTSMIEPTEPQILLTSPNPSIESASQSPSRLVIAENGYEDEREEVLSHQNEKGQKIFNDFRPRKASDYIKREAALRLKLLETTKRYDLQILKLKLDREKKENERATLLLEAAKLEVEYHKRRLNQLL